MVFLRAKFIHLVLCHRRRTNSIRSDPTPFIFGPLIHTSSITSRRKGARTADASRREPPCQLFISYICFFLNMGEFVILFFLKSSNAAIVCSTFSYFSLLAARFFSHRPSLFVPTFVWYKKGTCSFKKMDKWRCIIEMNLFLTIIIGATKTLYVLFSSNSFCARLQEHLSFFFFPELASTCLHNNLLDALLLTSLW